jgi:hypothetical protein
MRELAAAALVLLVAACDADGAARGGFCPEAI